MSRNKENLKPTWIKQKNDHVSEYTAASEYGFHSGDKEYVNLFDEHYESFSGKILEIGAGTGWFAKQILSSRENVEYTVLDIKSNIYTVKETLRDFENESYINSSEYEKIFDQEYDLFIATHCLSETPRYYYIDILDKLKTKSCFVIDYGGCPDDPGFEETLDNWFSTFTNKKKFKNLKLLGGDKCTIPVYIGNKRQE